MLKYITNKNIAENLFGLAGTAVLMGFICERQQIRKTLKLAKESWWYTFKE